MTNREKLIKLMEVPKPKRERDWHLKVAALFVRKVYRCPNCQRIHMARIFADETPEHVQCAEHQGQPMPVEAKLCA